MLRRSHMLTALQKVSRLPFASLSRGGAPVTPWAPITLPILVPTHLLQCRGFVLCSRSRHTGLAAEWHRFGELRQLWRRERAVGRWCRQPADICHLG